MEHIFVDFDQILSGAYKRKLQEILERGHDVIITVEPFDFRGSTADPNMLKGIISGDFDHIFKKFYEELPDENTAIYSRFAHEMEIPVDRYPWQLQDPPLYIKAFRYFMQYPGSDKENIERVWAPAGDRGSVEWWPGSDVVDYISMSVYGLPGKNITDFKKQDSFEEIFERKSRRLDLFGKPFLIAEFGVKGEEEYQRQWLLDAAEVIEKNKNIFGVSYFNREDVPKAWGEIAPPDWSITPEIFNSFTEGLNTP